MSTNHARFGLGLLLATTSGCGLIIGIDDYRVDDSSSSVGGSAGNGNGNGDGGTSHGDGGTSSGGGGTSSGGGGTSSGGGGTSSGGTANTGGKSSTGGGGPIECATGCDDDNDCTVDQCVADECEHSAVDVGTECGDGVCNATQQCVACLNDEPDYEPDTGCNSIAPRCDTTAPDAPVCTGCMLDTDCNDGNDCTAEQCEEHWCVQNNVLAGSTCGDGHACNDTGTCVRCWNTANGTGQDAGCPDGAPICNTTGADPLCTGCVDATDCNDDNPCTTESCNAAHECEYEAVDRGTTCNGGVCNADAKAPACVTCVDDQMGTTLSDVDAGCGASTPFCVEGTKCVACVGAGNCSDDIDCTTDSCNAEGACVHTENNSACPYDADAHLCGKCSASAGAGTGCVAGVAAPVESANLLVNPNIDGGAGWQQYSQVLMGDLIWAYDPEYLPTRLTGDYYVYLGDWKNEKNLFYQDVTLSPNAVGVKVWGSISRSTDENTDGDWAWVKLRVPAAGSAIEGVQVDELVRWNSVTTPWQSFSYPSYISEWTNWTGTKLRVEFGATNDNGATTAFFLDDLGVSQLTCN